MGHILHRVVDVKSSLFRLSKIVGKHSIYWCTPLCSSSSPSPDNISGQWDNLQFSMNSMVFFQNSGSFPLVIPYSFVNLSAHHHSIHTKNAYERTFTFCRSMHSRCPCATHHSLRRPCLLQNFARRQMAHRRDQSLRQHPRRRHRCHIRIWR